MNETKLVLRVDMLPSDPDGGGYVDFYPDNKHLFFRGFKTPDNRFRAVGTIYFADDIRVPGEQLCPGSTFVAMLPLGSMDLPLQPWYTDSSTLAAAASSATNQLMYWARGLLKRGDGANILSESGASAAVINKFKEVYK